MGNIKVIIVHSPREKVIVIFSFFNLACLLLLPLGRDERRGKKEARKWIKRGNKSWSSSKVASSCATHGSLPEACTLFTAYMKTMMMLLFRHMKSICGHCNILEVVLSFPMCDYCARSWREAKKKELSSVSIFSVSVNLTVFSSLDLSRQRIHQSWFQGLRLSTNERRTKKVG